MSEYNFKPLGRRVLARRERPEEKTSAGLYIPEQARFQPLQAVVVAVGPQVKEDIQPGQRIYFERYGQTDIELMMKQSEGMEDFILVPEDKILGVEV